MKNIILIIFIFFALQLTLNAQPPDCYTSQVKRGDDALRDKDYGVAIKQYFSAFSCDYLEGYPALQDRIQRVLSELERAKGAAEASEKLARANELRALNATAEALRERDLKDSALHVASVYARKAEALLMSSLAQNLLLKGKDPDEALLLAYAGYQLAPLEVRGAAYATFCEASYLHTDTLWKSNTSTISKVIPFNSGNGFIILEKNKLSILQPGKDVISLPLDEQSNWDVHIAPNDNYFVISSYAPELKIYNTDGSIYANHRFHSEPVSAISFSPDSKKLMTGGRDDKIVIYDLAQKEEKVIESGRGNVYQLEPVPATGGFVARTSEGVLIYYGAEGQVLSQTDENYFRSAAVRFDKPEIFGLDANGEILKWSPESRELKDIPFLATAKDFKIIGPSSLLISSDTVISILSDQSVKTYRSDRIIIGMEYNDPGNLIFWDESGRLFQISGANDEWTLLSGDLKVIDATFSNDAKYVLARTANGKAILLHGDQQLHSWSLNEDMAKPVWFGNDNSHFFILEEQGRLSRYDLPHLLSATMKEEVTASKPAYVALGEKYHLAYISELWKDQ